MNFLLAKVIGTHCTANATAINTTTTSPSSRHPTHSTPPPATSAPSSTRSTVTNWEAPAPPDAPATYAATALPASDVPRQ
eukprot:5783186-Pleurochrysis_carterae.AAC.1